MTQTAQAKKIAANKLQQPQMDSSDVLALVDSMNKDLESLNSEVSNYGSIVKRLNQNKPEV